MVLVGCVAYRAPMISYQSGPENAYNQERSGVISRSTSTEQQVAETTAAQTQSANDTTANMPTALDLDKQIGLKQGKADTGAAGAGRDATDATATGSGEAQGQQGGDAVSAGTNPVATTDNSGAPTE